MEDNGKDVARNDNHRCLRKEPLHRCLFGLLENFCTSPSGIYYRCGKVVVASTWDKQKRKSNIGRIDGSPLFVIQVVSLHTPFWSKQGKIAWTCPSNASRNEIPLWPRLVDVRFIWLTLFITYYYPNHHSLILFKSGTPRLLFFSGSISNSMISGGKKIEIEKMAVSELMGLTELLNIQYLANIYFPSHYPFPPAYRQAGRGEGIGGEGHCFSNLKWYNNLPIASW